jgi:hypothetical protein
MTAEVPLEIFPKYADEKVLLGFTFRRDVARGVSVSSIASIAITKMGDVLNTADGDITVSGLSFAGQRVQAYFSGGVAGERYLVKVKANMSDGQAPLEIHIYLYIKQV